jgi:hypothetical protein
VKALSDTEKPAKKKQVVLAALASIALLLGCAAHIFASQATKPDCRLDAGPCVRTDGALTLILDITPKPLEVMRELTFTVIVKEGGKPVPDALLLIDLSMPGMYMGKNVVRLTHRADGVYEGTGVIIRCPSGGKIWQALVIMERAEKKSVVNYLFEVP